jgi:ankyrin repeat protein
MSSHNYKALLKDTTYKNGDTDLITAVRSRCKENVCNSIKRTLNINEKGRNGNTALHYAYNNGDIEIVMLLEMNGASIHSKNRWGFTPITFSNESKYLREKYIKELEELEEYFTLPCEDDDITSNTVTPVSSEQLKEIKHIDTFSENDSIEYICSEALFDCSNTLFGKLKKNINPNIINAFLVAVTVVFIHKIISYSIYSESV